jgi:hypothetical protein
MERRLGAFGVSVILALMSVGVVSAATPPANDQPSGAIPLKIGASLDWDSSYATESPRHPDPTNCRGSHGSFPGPYFASVWFSYTATNQDRWLFLSSPTIQGDPKDFLAITFVFADTSSGLQLVDCTAYGNDATWQPTPGTRYLIMEAGLSSAVTEFPPLSDRGGHGTMTLFQSASKLSHYHYLGAFTSSDCGFPVNGTVENSGVFALKVGRQGDPTPYFFDNYEYHVVTTNPANGKWFREDGNGIYKDVHITNVEGTIYTFVTQETGHPYVLTDMNGNRVFFDRGRLLTTFQVDTQGDNDLSNDVFIDGSFQLLAANGSHPGFFFAGDFCDIVRDLLG